MTTIGGAETMPHWVAIAIIAIWLGCFLGMLCWIAFKMLGTALSKEKERT